MGIHSSGFKDFLLKPELLRAIQDCGFEHPSEGALTLSCVREASMAQHGKQLPVARVQLRACWQPAPDSCSPSTSACPRLPHRSATRVHPPGHSGHGCDLPGQVGHGQDRRVRHLVAAAAGACGWPGALGEAAVCRLIRTQQAVGRQQMPGSAVGLSAGACRVGNTSVKPYCVADWAVPPPPCCLAQVSVVVLCHTRELAFQICHEYER